MCTEFPKPNVSIVIPHYNRADLLGKTLESLTQQSYETWEALVVDDGSSPTCIEAVSNLAEKDQRIRFVQREREPKGANTCRNIGIDLARGSFLVFLDSDDLLASFCLERRVSLFSQHLELGYLVFQVAKFREQPGDTELVWNTENDEDNLARFLKQESVWHTTGPIWRRETILKLGGFDERLACWQDVDLHVRALAAELSYKICMDEPADCFYRMHAESSISQGGFRGRPQLESLATVFATCADLPACRALPERCLSLSKLATVVAFKQLECKAFDLYGNVSRMAAKHDLLTHSVKLKLALLNLFFRAGGYSIKGSHRLRPYFRSMLGC